MGKERQPIREDNFIANINVVVYIDSSHRARALWRMCELIHHGRRG